MRVIFVSKSAQEKDNIDNERYRQQEERQQQENARREDLDQEKGIWNDTLQARIGQEWPMEKALAEADMALEEYRKRFQ